MNRYLPILYVVTAVLAIALSIMATRSLHNFYHHTDFSPPPRDESGAVGSQPARPALTFDDLLDAIEWVESKGDPWAVGDGGNAVGSFQIHEIYFNDVKRIQLKRTATFSWSACMFTLDDRLNRQDSREMVTIYLKHYGGTFEAMARKHNGGPNGHNKESTKAYWLKVKARMEAK